ncbi:MAG: type II toxin-antitoxin system Phd/YefM family antitoxin [Anaerolineae bacterium]|jgi:prevent-host-death family protein
MSETAISLTELKQNLGEVVNRAAYGNERIILLSRGTPRAVIMSIDDLERLRQFEASQPQEDKVQQQLALLSEMDALREQIRQEHGELTDSVEVLREVREERLNDIMGLS